MNISTGPLTREVYEICVQHEGHPASDLQSTLAIRISAFGDKVETLERESAALRTSLDTATRERDEERNLHRQTRVVVEELDIIANDLRNAGQPQFIRSEAIRLYREEIASLRSLLAAANQSLAEAQQECRELVWKTGKCAQVEIDKCDNRLKENCALLAAMEKERESAEEDINDAWQALGLARPEAAPIAPEIRRIRDEGRRHFHDLTAAQADVERLTEELKIAHLSTKQPNSAPN